MSAPHTERLSKREGMAVSGAAITSAPLGAAVVTGGAVTLADLGLHVLGGTALHLSAVSGSLTLGVAAFALVAAIGALVRAGKSGRAGRWVRSNPWSFALLPGASVAAIALVLSIALGGGILSGIVSGLWHGVVVFGVTGAAGTLSRSRRKA